MENNTLCNNWYVGYYTNYCTTFNIIKTVDTNTYWC